VNVPESERSRARAPACESDLAQVVVADQDVEP
jgi:hypothetical protein